MGSTFDMELFFIADEAKPCGFIPFVGAPTKGRVPDSTRSEVRQHEPLRASTKAIRAATA